MIQFAISKTAVTLPSSNCQFTKKVFYRGYKTLSDGSTSMQSERDIPSLKIVNVSQKEGNGICYIGETVFNVQKEHMQNFYERMNKRFGG